MTGMNDFTIAQRFANALIEGNHWKCQQMTDEITSGSSDFKFLYENVLKKALYIVGDMWERNQISVAAEHMATAIVESILNRQLLAMEMAENAGKSLLLSCVEHEMHQVGIKMVGDVFESHGWKTYYLGANVPVNDLISFAELTKPQIIALSLSVYFHLNILDQMISKIRDAFPEITILVGGQGFMHGGTELLKKYEGVYYLTDLNDVEQFIKTIN
jgi:MerR family transcriptional regulator, light-induced transcriptional regulator